MTNHHSNSSQPPNRIALLGLVVLFIATFFPVIRSLVETWIQSDDYSHGLLIVPVSLYIIYQKRDDLKKIDIVPGSGGVFWVAFAIMLYVFGYLAEISTLSSLSLVLTIWAIVWSLFGKEVVRIIFFPMLLLLLMIPVPAQFYSMATIPLQLLVSKTSAFIGGFLGVPHFERRQRVASARPHTGRCPGMQWFTVAHVSGDTLRHFWIYDPVFQYIAWSANC